MREQKQWLHEQAQALAPWMTALRRELHRHPELSGQEEWTRGRIGEELAALGLPYEQVDGNLYAVLDGARPGKTVVLRADFDALPVQEEADVPFRSQCDGVMHACGHDGHVSMLLGAAKALAQLQAELCGRVVFCFQYGEEQGRGAAEAIAWLEKQPRVDAVCGLHVMSDIPTGQIMLQPGPVMAGGTGFQLQVRGKGGHGSSPWAAVDPLKPLCEILLRYTSLNVNRFDVFDSFVVSPGVISGGTVANIIPETAAFQATIRYFNTGTFPRLQQELEHIARTVAESYHAAAEMMMGPPMPPVVNDASLIARVAPLVEAIEGLSLSGHAPFMLSDNFALLLQRFPGFYGFLGIGNHALGSDVAHHNPQFKLDEAALPLGCEFLASGALELLREG